MRGASFTFLAVVAAAIASPLPRALPTPVNTATAKTYLSQCTSSVDLSIICRSYAYISVTVAVDSNSPAYVRSAFKLWDISKLTKISPVMITYFFSFRKVQYARK